MAVVDESAVARFFQAVERGDTVAATEVVLELWHCGVRTGEIVRSVLARSLEEVGRRWERADWTVAQEHAATAVADAALATLLWTASSEGTRRARSGRMVVACVENEWHSFAGRLAAADLLDAGLDVTFLGPSLPARHLAEYLDPAPPAACGISCVALINLVGARQSIAAAHEVGVPVIAGGTAIRSAERAKALGADGWAATGPDATALIERWQRRPPILRRAIDVPPDVEVLRSPPTHLIDAAVDEMLLRYPPVARFDDDTLARTREDLIFILLHAAAALVVDDPVLFLDFTAWLMRLLEPRRVPIRSIALGYQALIEALGPDFPSATALLTGALNVLPGT